MPTTYLVRHAQSQANESGILAGRLAHVQLSERGEQQAEQMAERFADVRIAVVVTSPLERCVATARGLIGQREGLPLEVDDAFLECDYGSWSGRPLRDLMNEPLWATVQRNPEQVQFPDGEGLLAMAARACAGWRRWDAAVAERYGPDAAWCLVSHGDIIKAIVADAIGLHLTLFQRLEMSTASVSVVRNGVGGSALLTFNQSADLPGSVHVATGSSSAHEAGGHFVVGGGTL